jgi:3-oxoacyl-(acyl-carrier-protein) synthase
MQERIVITGMGTVNPLGLSVSETWRNALAGVSGIGPITLFDPANLNIKYACEVKNFSPDSFLDPKEVRRRDRFELMAAAAVKEAIEQSGLAVTEENAGRVGVVISSAIGGMQSLQEAIFIMKDEGARRVSPFLIPMLMSNGAAGLASIDYGLRGPSLSVASACASGADGIGMAWLMLRAGVLDVVLAGASEATICETGIAAFDRIGAMSRRESYAMTPQPFDRDRDGLVMGEGAAVLVLERESHARARGAVILAELAGYAATADAFHITAPAPSSDGAVM